jgi:hypothetical protein
MKCIVTMREIGHPANCSSFFVMQTRWIRLDLGITCT